MSFLINPYVYAGFDPDAQAFITAAGITDTTQQNAINTLVLDLKGYGIWSKMKAIYPFIGGTASTHKWNLKDPRDLDAAFRLLFYGGFTHNSNGIQGNSTNTYCDTRINASTVLTNNNLHLSFYSRINTTTQNFSNEIMLGRSYAASGNIALRTNNKATGNAFFSGGNDSTEGVIVSDTSLGFTIGTETSSSLRKFIKNNTILGTNTTNSTTALGNANIVMWGHPSLNYSGNQCAFASIGDGLTDTEATNLYTAVQTFQTTLGRSIGPQTVSDPDAQAFVTAANIQDQVQATAVNNLTIGLKADGLWNKMKAIYPFVGGDAASHKFNLKDPRDLDAAFRLVFNGGWTHSSNGILPNGTNAYADTKLNVNSILTLNNTHTSIYSITNNTVAGVDFGCTDATAQAMRMHLKWTDNNGYYDMYNGTSNRITYSMASTNSTGLFVSNRTSNVLFNIWRNSTKLSTSTTTQNGLIPNKIIFIGADNGSSGGNPTIQFYSNRQYAFASIGDGLTDTDAANLYSRVQTFQTALNRQV